mmetsp:Transcript_90920/g.229176  ORF Transcript_90920/g.229176 Transcript_90920/m.229176 type:complete len:215 (-) Transcript_90920:594-1238(-)
MVQAVELHEEVAQAILGVHVPCHDLRVVLRVEAVGNVVDSDTTVAGPVQRVEGHEDQLLAAVVDLPADSNHELVVADCLGAIFVDGLHEQVEIGRLHVEPKAAQADLKLLTGQLLVPVGVHDPESAAQGLDAMRAAPLEDELPELPKDELRHVNLHRGLLRQLRAPRGPTPCRLLRHRPVLGDASVAGWVATPPVAAGRPGVRRRRWRPGIGAR